MGLELCGNIALLCSSQALSDAYQLDINIVRAELFYSVDIVILLESDVYRRDSSVLVWLLL